MNITQNTKAAHTLLPTFVTGKDWLWMASLIFSQAFPRLEMYSSSFMGRLCLSSNLYFPVQTGSYVTISYDCKWFSSLTHAQSFQERTCWMSLFCFGFEMGLTLEPHADLELSTLLHWFTGVHPNARSEVATDDA